MTRRVVITGAGAFTPLGDSVPATVAAMLAGRVALGEMDFPDAARLGVKIGGQIAGYDANARFSRSEIALYDPFTQFALIAAAEAMAQAAPSLTAADADRSGVILGTAGGGLQTQDANFKAVYEDGKNRVHPFTVPRLMANAAAAQVSMAHGLRGPSYTVATACASSNHAIGQAFHLVRAGAAEVMVAGGSESMLCFGGIKAWEGLRVLSPDGCRPFCRTRNGMVQGEGAGAFVLEPLDRAQARGVPILAEVLGFAMSSDAGDIVQPDPAGAARAMAAAVADAGRDGADVGYVNAHGTATAANDVAECRALRLAFGDRAAEAMAISSTKSMHGHLMGATGAVELLAVIAALRDGVVAPTEGVRDLDPACDLDIVHGAARAQKVDFAISNAFAFGGLNAVLALGRAP
ncbi:MAG: beta-ketoacyl-[acyl-carrier-protein] synthase family protein [Pseudomonadota bacterium]